MGNFCGENTEDARHLCKVIPIKIKDISKTALSITVNRKKLTIKSQVDYLKDEVSKFSVFP